MIGTITQLHEYVVGGKSLTPRCCTVQCGDDTISSVHMGRLRYYQVGDVVCIATQDTPTICGLIRRGT